MTFFRFFSLVVVLSVMMAAPSYARQTIGTQTLLERYTTAVEQGETQGARDVALQLSSSDFSDTPLGLSAREVRSVKMELAEELAEMGFFEDGISILSPLLEKDEAELSNTTDPVGRTALLNAYFERLSLMGQLATQQGEFDRTIVARGKAVAALQRLYFGSFVAGIDKLDTFPDIDSAGVVSIDLISREDRWARTPDNRFLRKFYDNQTRQAVSDLFAALDRRAFANEQSGNSVRALIDLYRMRSLAREQCAFGFSDVCAADGTLLLSMTDTARRIAAQWEAYAGQVETKVPDLSMKMRDTAIHLLSSEFGSDDAKTAAAIDRRDSALKGLFGPDAAQCWDGTYISNPQLCAPAPFAGAPPSPTTTVIAASFPERVFSDPSIPVTVFYGTNRAVRKPTDPEKYYGRKLSNQGRDLVLGTVDTTVPRNLPVGDIGSPGPRDAVDGIHIVLKRVNVSSSQTSFAQSLNASVTSQPAGEREMFVFVHGHGVPFNSAVRRTAKLAVDLDMKEGAALFTWPAGKTLTGYRQSERMSSKSAEALRDYLTLITDRSGADKIHLVAHSMGNRILIEALKQIEANRPDSDAPRFAQVIFASPDVPVEGPSSNVNCQQKPEDCEAGFLDSFPSIDGVAENMTLYASRHDKALLVSNFINRARRIGFSPPDRRVSSLLTTVDTSDLDRGKLDVIAHGDYALGAIEDLRGVVWYSLAPDSRCILTNDAQGFWRAETADRCDINDFSQALTLVRESKLDEAREVIARESTNTQSQSRWSRISSIIDGIFTRR